MYGRRATEGDDLWPFDEFQCVRNGEQCERTVEEWIRLLAFRWVVEVPDAYLFAFMDDDDSLIAVCGHAPSPDEDAIRFVPALGVRTDKQGNKLGRRILYTVYLHAASVCPGGSFVFNVEPENTPSIEMCARLGWEALWVPSLDGPWREYRIGLPVDAGQVTIPFDVVGSEGLPTAKG